MSPHGCLSHLLRLMDSRAGKTAQLAYLKLGGMERGIPPPPTLFFAFSPLKNKNDTTVEYSKAKDKFCTFLPHKLICC